ncbi:MAG TPA: VTT domain-containing protein [Thermomicrobiales bacterium]|nr:VTT domain-containing protein [Thermomicrobiales bacterium]
MPFFLDPTFILGAGYLGLFLVIFAETGLLVGFFLPGDSLLFTAGLLASQHVLDIRWVVMGCFVAAVAGNATGYSIGRRFGRSLFRRPESLLFKPEHLQRAEAFFEEHGGKAIVLAQFIPIIRTFTPVVAGISALPYRRFFMFNVVGAILWAIGVPVAGFNFGRVIPNPDRYILPIVGLIILISVLPPALKAWRAGGREVVAQSVSRARARRTSGS